MVLPFPFFNSSRYMLPNAKKDGGWGGLLINWDKNISENFVKRVRIENVWLFWMSISNVLNIQAIAFVVKHKSKASS